MKALRVAVPAVILCAMLGARADIIIFKNGDELDGNIIEKTDVAIKLEVSVGTMLIPMERVLRIDKETAPEQIEARRKKKEEADAFAKKMKEEHMVLYKGEWVDEDEKAADLKKIAEERKAKKDAEEAKRKADELAAAAQKLKDDAAQMANNNNNQNNRNNRFNNNHNTMSSYGQWHQQQPYGGGSSFGGSSNYNNGNRGY